MRSFAAFRMTGAGRISGLDNAAQRREILGMDWGSPL